MTPRSLTHPEAQGNKDLGEPAASGLEEEVKDLKALLADCYMALHDHHHEAQPSYDQPPEPADEWSYNIVPLFVAIQRATGKDHGQLLLLPTSAEGAAPTSPQPIKGESELESASNGMGLR